MKQQNTRLWLSGLVFGALGLTNCELEEPCDPGFTYEQGVCYPNEETGEGTGGTESGDGDDNAGLGGSTDPDTPNFGTECEDDSVCINGAVCGLPFEPFCIGYCGPNDPFSDGCPDGLECRNVGVEVCVPAE